VPPRHRSAAFRDLPGLLVPAHLSAARLDREREMDHNRCMGVRSAAFAWLAFLAALVACARQASEPDGLFFPTVPRQDAYPTALLSAQLVERSGCLFATDGKDRWLLLWPEGYSARTEPDGRVQVVNEDGWGIGTVGEPLSVGGGETNPIEVGGNAAADEWAQGLTGQRTPTACGHLYWLVAP
jgi:hypothetical protein